MSSPSYKNPNLLCIPGGLGKDVLKGLRIDVKKFVEDGGTYFGICCGAYIACEHIHFEENIQQGLGLIQVNSSGPLYKYDDQPFDIRDKRNSRITPVTDVFTSHVSNIYYHGGGTFEHSDYIKPCNDAFMDVARYKTEEEYDTRAFVVEALYENKQPAVISCRVGKGLIVLSGVHPEHEDSIAGPIFHRVFTSYSSINMRLRTIYD